jgi:diketogulonate reductase-like aldo/keto reductase
MAKEISITITVTEEQVREAFENAEVKFSKKKLKEIMEIFKDNPETMEEYFLEQIEGLSTEV